MIRAFTRFGICIAATAVAVLLAGAGYQHLNAQGPGVGGPGGGFGGPGGGGFGGPGGRGGGPGRPGGPAGGILPPMVLERLELSTDQRDRVRQIMDSHRDEQRSLGDRAMKAHEALQEVITGTFDESAVRARAADVAAVDADMAVAQARVFGEVFQILTPEQQQKLRQIQTEMKDRWAKMRERRGQAGDAGPRGDRRGQR